MIRINMTFRIVIKEVHGRIFMIWLSDNVKRRTAVPMLVLLILLGQCVPGWTKMTSSNNVKEDCSTDRLQACMNLLQTINKDHNLAFASTEEELLNMCSTMKTGLECVYGHVTRCFDKERRELIYNLLQGTEDVIRLLCSPGKFRDKYKIHAPCMKNVSTDSRMCGPHYQMLIRSVNPKDDVSATDTIRRQCCAFHTYLLCVTEVAESECGHDAADFIKDYSYRTAGPLIKNQCKNYKAGSLMCSFFMSSTERVTSSYWLILSSSIIFLLQDFNC